MEYISFGRSRALNPALAPFVHEARRYYLKEYMEYDKKQRDNYLKGMKYFDMLLMAYFDNLSFVEIGIRYKMSCSNARTQLLNCESKVITYLKLKDMGRL